MFVRVRRTWTVGWWPGVFTAFGLDDASRLVHHPRPGPGELVDWSVQFIVRWG